MKKNFLSRLPHFGIKNQVHSRLGKGPLATTFKSPHKNLLKRASQLFTPLKNAKVGNFLSTGIGLFGALFFCLPVLGINHYKFLDVPQTATAEEIMEAFVMKMGETPSTHQQLVPIDHQQQLRKSYAVLRDPHKRRKYDESLPAVSNETNRTDTNVANQTNTSSEVAINPVRQTTALHRILQDPRIRNARLSSQNGICCPPSHLCRECRNVENDVLRNLVDQLDRENPRVDINAITEHNGNTALMLAVRRKIPKAVQLLIKHGARVDIPNDKGQSPLQEAERSSDQHTKRHFSYGEDRQLSREIAKMIRKQEELISLPLPEKKGLLISAINQNKPKKFKVVWLNDTRWTQEDVNELMFVAMQNTKKEWWMSYIQTLWSDFTGNACRQQIRSTHRGQHRIRDTKI